MSSASLSLSRFSEVDLKLQQLRRQLKQLQGQIDEIRKPVTDLEEQIAELTEQYEEVAKNSKDSQNELALHDLRITKLEEQVPRIRTQKEFIASKKQLEDHRRDRSDVEERLLALDIDKEELQGKLDTLKGELETEQSSFESSITDLTQKQKELDGEIASRKTQHDELFEDLDERIQKFYNHSIQNGLIPPICSIQQQTCSGCHLQIQPQLMNEMIANPEEHRTCPNCGRITYYIPPPK